MKHVSKGESMRAPMEGLECSLNCNTSFGAWYVIPMRSTIKLSHRVYVAFGTCIHHRPIQAHCTMANYELAAIDLNPFVDTASFWKDVDKVHIMLAPSVAVG